MPPDSIRLTVVGSVNLDLVTRAKRLPRPGETLTNATFDRYPGGKGANQAVAAARLGAEVRFVGCVGADPFAEEALAGLRGAEVDLSVEAVAAPTGVASILVDETGENVIVVAPGANRLLRAPHFEGGETVLCQLEIPVDTVVECAASAGSFWLNAAPAVPIPASLVERADVVIANSYELEGLPATPALAVVTLGEEGAVLLEAGRETARARPPKVDAVDGTAAGDAFAACLVVSRLEDRPWDEALERSCAAGALAASRAGAQPSLPTAAEIDEILSR
ncbi:MAG TPA: ribokinase [Gaiellaceae bacterium]|nr:ribokinase [Gaiellaceae bacterium]